MNVPDYTPFLVAAGRAGQPQAAFDALCALAQEVVGAKLFTVMTSDRVQRVNARVYSNMPDAYPVSGTKPANETDWSRQVIEEKKTFVANDIEGIADVFGDWELIQSLGCESVMNVPILIDGEVAGTINCLDVAGHYTADRVAAAEALKLPGLVCLLLNQRMNKGA
ncbi:GAF domain-containing protein [Aquibium carbonis]|uniref:GAF domain-containing protein n=1 Tax=Aquibium carbonis TaxID=2495581 RepID=A0A429YV37_9HYPH|nr:GAF domain-containing protein [Aquibium carbonis]RST85292.1 GAF domain-containing protein [Aquibium carbonis]